MSRCKTLVENGHTREQDSSRTGSEIDSDEISNPATPLPVYATSAVVPTSIGTWRQDWSQLVTISLPRLIERCNRGRFGKPRPPRKNTKHGTRHLKHTSCPDHNF